MTAMTTNEMHRLAMPVEKLDFDPFNVSNIFPNRTLNAGRETPVTTPPKVPRAMIATSERVAVLKT